MEKISAYILAFNEAEKIADAVSSVLWADEIVVADSGSTDGTAEIAESLGARVVQLPFHGFGDLRNRAIAECRHEWIFSLDSDERCTPEVRDEILEILSSVPEHDAYLLPRRNYMMGRWIKGSGWYPNFRQPQLFRKGAMRYDDDPVHEGYHLLTPRPLGRLQGAIWQFPFRNLAEVIQKMNRYSSLGVQKLGGKRVSMGSALGHGVWSFLKHFLFKHGYRDGWAAEYVAIEVRSLAPKPTTVDFIEAAAIPQAALTSWQALFDHGHLESGQTVVIHGAGGGVGSVGVQLARWAGAHVVGTGRARARRRVLEFGADDFVDVERDGWETAVGQVDLVYDAIGGEVLARSPAIVKAGGTLVSVMALPQTDRHDIRTVHFVRDPSGAQLREINRLVDEGKLRPQVDAVYPLADAREAFMAKSTQHIPGKVVLTP